MGQTMNTRHGAIDVTVQDARTAYVRVGTGDRDDSTPADAVLELPRGAAASGRAHFKLEDGVWSCMRPASVYGLRRANGGDLTPTMREAAHGIIAEALEGITTEALDDAQYARNVKAAGECRTQAAALCAMADQLNRQATELEMDRGARVVYVEQQLRSGTQQHATAVRTSSGELLFVDEPRGSIPFLAHDGRGLRRWADEPAEWKERD
jgi:hypothetical protein